VNFLEAHEHGVVLNVRAYAGARSRGIKGVQAGRLQVSVTQAPEKGKANQAIVELLAEELQVRRRQIELLSGETSAQKRFLLREVAAPELQARIDALLKD